MYVTMYCSAICISSKIASSWKEDLIELVSIEQTWEVHKKGLEVIGGQIFIDNFH